MHLRSLPLVLALCTLPAVAQFGNGGNGDIETGPLSINAPFAVTVSGAPGMPFEIFVSDGPGPVVIGPFVVSLDVASPSFASLFAGTIGPGGTATFGPIFVPNDPNIANFFVFYMQGIVIDPGHPTGVALTRAIRLDLETPDTFLPLPNLAAPRALATGDALNDGRVLVAGGGNGTLLAPVATTTTEIYQPFTRTWSAGPNLSIQRSFHASAVLNDGRVLLTGGTSTSGSVTNTCDIFDPATNTMSAAGSMAAARAGHAATTLNDGRVLVTGGVSTFVGTALGPILNSASNTGEVYNPATNTWSPVSNTMGTTATNGRRFVHTQNKLPDGRILCVSGISGATNIIIADVPTYAPTWSLYNPATNAFTSTTGFPGGGRAAHRATLMPNGEVIVTGGISGTLPPAAINDTRIYTVATNSWAAGPLLTSSAALQGQVLLKNGKIHVSGGGVGSLTAFSATDTCSTRAVGGAFINSAILPSARGFHLAVRLQDGSILISGGGDSSAAAVDTNLLYTPAP